MTVAKNFQAAGSFLKAWTELIFPPFCACCKEKCNSRLFCPSCWELCAPPDPDERCSHCFEESEGMCKQCKSNSRFPFRRAFAFHPTPPAFHLARTRPDLLASFFVLQWVRLDWPTPDVVVPMRGMKKIAKAFAEMIDRPFASVLKWRRCDFKAIEENQVLLLLDNQSGGEKISRAVSLLGETFPKKGFLLSLFPYDLVDS